jgi:hypothetical protein
MDLDLLIDFVYGTGRNPFYVVPGDLNNDNRQGFIVTNSDSGDLSVFLNVWK